jgi:hypothetical protein
MVRRLNDYNNHKFLFFMLNGRCESNDGQNFQVVMVRSCSYHVLSFDTAVFEVGTSASGEHVASIFRKFMALQNVSVNLQYCVVLTKRVHVKVMVSS